MTNVCQTNAVHRADAEGAHSGIADGGRFEERPLASLTAIDESFGTIGRYYEEGGVGIERGGGEDAEGGCHRRRRQR